VEKSDLQKHIAETAYNIGYGAKKHFATHDIVAKVPGIIGFISIAIGIFALFIESLTSKHLSATFIVLGVASLYITKYDHKKEEYADIGRDLTNLFNQLRALYLNVQSSDNENLTEYENRLTDIQTLFNKKCLSDQVLFSDWYAHYKFFWQQQIDWIDQEKNFSFLRDKIPLSFSISAAAVASAAAYFAL